MTTRQVSIFAAALLAVGCAHGKSEKTAKGDGPNRTAAVSAEQAEARAERAEDRAEKAGERAEDEVERVDVPAAGADRGRLANAGGEIPASERDKRSEGTQRAESAQAYGTSPDNTRVNERDRSEGSLTPMDQKENETDLEITQRIRQSVMGDDSLSFTAKNIKIITRDGQVTLRGSVKSAAEKSAIEKAARDVAGPAKVTSQIEISN